MLTFIDHKIMSIICNEKEKQTLIVINIINIDQQGECFSG